MVVAIAENNVIGNKGTLPWRLSTDLKRFKNTTMGHALLMGRKTYDSIGRPLPRTQDDRPIAEGGLGDRGCSTATTLEQALRSVPEGMTAYIVGGSEIYRLAYPIAQELLVTRVRAVVEGDTYWDPIDPKHWKLDRSEHAEKGPGDDYEMDFERWIRSD